MCEYINRLYLLHAIKSALITDSHRCFVENHSFSSDEAQFFDLEDSVSRQTSSATMLFTALHHAPITIDEAVVRPVHILTRNSHTALFSNRDVNRYAIINQPLTYFIENEVFGRISNN